MKKLTAGFCAIALAAVPTAQAMAARVSEHLARRIQ